MQNILLRYPCFGKIVRSTDRGFGFIGIPDGEDFIHLRDHVGRKFDTMEGLEGKPCAYVIGGHAFKYSNDKDGWAKSVVEWQLLDDIKIAKSISSYKLARKNALDALDNANLKFFLSADWYVQLWRQKTKGRPKSVLQADSLLDNIIRKRLAEVDNIEELVHLLASICESPWYVSNDAERASVCKRFFHPSDWPAFVFFKNKSLELCHGYSVISSLCGAELDEYALKARVVAIDLESNGKDIFEFGWKNAFTTDVHRANNGLNRDELLEAVSKCLYGQSDPCIVSHNLLAWDLPILQKNQVFFPESTAWWDTLLASWLLEPWRNSHALIVKERAHSADADATTCYELFESQIGRLAVCLKGHSTDVHSLVENLFENPKLFEEIEGRNYPHDLQNSRSGFVVFPLCKMNEFSWQKNCRLELVAQKSKLADPMLNPDRCRIVAEKEGTIYAKAVAAIVADAFIESVEVHLSYLPSWLVDERLKELLKDAHREQDRADEVRDRVVIYLAEDLFELADDDLKRLFANGDFTVAHPVAVALKWQEAQCQILKEVEVQNRFPIAVENLAGRALIPVNSEGGEASWLLYAPPGLGVDSPSWSLLRTLPTWLPVQNGQAQDAANALPWIPRWRDGDASRLDIDRLFASPDTANRPLYLADLTHCLLNLLKSCPENEVILVGVRWRKESEQLQRNLVQLGISSEHPGTPLRQLESICQKKLRILVCVRDDISKFMQAAIRLDRKLQVVLDEVPLHDWYAMLNTPSTPLRVDEHADNVRQCHVGKKIIFSANDIQLLSNIFLFSWLQGMGMLGTNNNMKCLILDSRVAKHRAATGEHFFSQQDIPFYSLEELLDEDVLQVFYSLCYPKRDEQNVPNDYDSYRSFLKENWGYPDFRPGTQRPAIERLIQTSRDILLRLPTGAGKSIVFHLPALLRSRYSGRLTVVISPLRALMIDQVEGLWRKRFTESVDYLSGGRDAWLNHEVYLGILDGRIHLVFVAPERFRSPRFTEVLERRRRMDGGLEFVVFDEVHCISEWGFEFRPDYLHAAKYVAEWFKTKDLPGNPHRLLLTSATVTQRNRIDLEVELGLGNAGNYEVLPNDMPHPIQPYIVLESFDMYEDKDAPSDEKFEKTCEILKGLDLDRSAALVFVRRRKDCHRISEALNERAAVPGTELASIHALPFHAGLPEAVKTEACDLLRDKRANVLVCTKAFGMGMDIPHLHACIHYQPPTFIEDYLQEVGRVGRDAKEREHTDHDSVTATLLYNQNNLERNLETLHDKIVKPSDLQDFFKYCIDNGVFFQQIDKALCIIPSKVRISETRDLDENQVTNCLFWLERMGVLRIEGRHPPFLHMNLDLALLRNYAAGSDSTSPIANILLDFVTESSGVVKELTTPSPEIAQEHRAETIFGRMVKGLLRGVLALFAPSEDVETKLQVSVSKASPDRSSIANKIDVSLSMSKLMSRCGGISMDDLFAGLFDLNKVGALSLHKNFVVRRNGVPSGEEFFDLLNFAVERLLEPTGGRVDFFQRKHFESELRDWYSSFLSEDIQEERSAGGELDAPRHLIRRVQREVYRAISTSLRVLRNAKVELNESLSDSGVTQYARAIPESIRFTVVREVDESIRTMRQLLAYVSSVEDGSASAQGSTFEISLTKILNALGRKIRISRLKEIMKLIESGGYYGFEGGLNDWMSLITLNTQKPLPAYDPDSVEATAPQRIYKEMLERYELQILRAQAMILLAAMPSEHNKKYIDRYFQCVKAEDLERLLEDTVGDVDDEGLASNLMLQNLLSQVRKERFSKENEKLEKNPSQFAVCRAPFDRRLLVNAGPGSGKTHVLMMRCACLIHLQRIDPADILVLAFNRAVVFEIKDRIRTLFRSLGYGNYANRIDVLTFHSFALRHAPTTELYEDDFIGYAVHAFAETMKSDRNFARIVSSRYKAVLVDEFQDMNEDFYSVVKILISNCSGGGMVIGDDDQDILTWNRRDWQDKYGQRCPLDAAHYFAEFREALEPEEHNLTLNYRSVPEVVQRANGMIEKVAAQVGFSRMKGMTKLNASRKEHGLVKMPLDITQYPDLVRESLERKENIAALCRSNRECRQVYETLVKDNGIEVANVELLGSEDFALYQLRSPGALLDICRSRKEYDFIDSYIWDEMLKEYELGGFADMQTDRKCLQILYILVREELGRPRIRDLRAFIEQMRASDVGRLKAKIGIADKRAKLTIATVHKVKGLAFDTVLVMPSKENFPFMPPNSALPEPSSIDAAEEARLCYVAMTRARNQLYIGWGAREKSWWTCSKHNSCDESYRYVLRGSPGEIFVSWPGQANQVNSGLQQYIKKHVSIGDNLSLNNSFVHHSSMPVGLLSKHTKAILRKANKCPQLRVSNVIRYTCGSYFRERNPQFWDLLHDNVKQQGWFYTVLVEEA